MRPAITSARRCSTLALVPLLDYARQISELEKIARLSPPATLERELPQLGGTDPAAACLVCGARPARACAACGSVSYCGEAHQREDARWHDLVCDELRAIAEDAIFATTQSLATRTDMLIERIDRVRIETLTSWDDILEQPITGPLRRLLSDLATRPLTLARTLADLDIPCARGRVSIHVMAAARRERDVPPQLWATLAHLFPSTQFEIALIGPELDESPDHVRTDSPLSIRSHRGLYRRAQWPELGRPDLIIGYDCGITLYPSWKHTILELRGSGVPFVITSYRSWEAAAEARVLTAVGATQVSGPAPNPFASLASRRSSAIANDVARDNAWLTVWR